jgi:hypothetical protein
MRALSDAFSDLVSICIKVSATRRRLFCRHGGMFLAGFLSCFKRAILTMLLYIHFGADVILECGQKIVRCQEVRL